MKTFIVFCLVAAVTATPGYLYGYHHGSAPLGHDGRVVETPEVAHARAAHLAEHAKEAARNAYGYAHDAPAVHYVSAPYVHQVYAPVVAHGPPAPLDHKTGQVIDEPHVAHAKIAHLAAHAQEAAKTAGYGYGGDHSYVYSPVYAHGHYGAAPLGHDGRVVDEPAVAHAKAAHFAAHHEALASHY